VFEETLVEELRRLRARRSVVALALATVAHLGVLTAVAAFRLWSIEELPEPRVMVSFWAAPPAPPPPPPPPPPPRGRHASERVETPVDPDPKPVTQPVVVPPETPESAAPAVGAEDGVEGGVEGGVAGGVPGGVVGGEVGGTVGGVPGGLLGSAMRVGMGQVKEPKRIRYVSPIYPEEARRARIEGVVILDMVVDRNGNVGDVRVLRPLAHGLTEAAIAAVKQWVYEPSTVDGTAVDVVFTVTVRFGLM
jgi:periplasmic protein TonB